MASSAARPTAAQTKTAKIVQHAKQAARATEKTAQETVKRVADMVMAGLKALWAAAHTMVAAIAAGGTVAVLVVVIICMIALVIGSGFGIFFAAESAGDGMSLADAIAQLKDTKGCLMPIMQKAQEIYGYLPIEVQTMISDETGIPLEKIYGVSTFYSQFALQPKGKYQISVCLGTACYVKGSGDIFKKLEEILGITNGQCTPDGKFSLDSCRCVGACGLAPVMMINEEVYGRLTPDQIPGILAKYK